MEVCCLAVHAGTGPWCRRAGFDKLILVIDQEGDDARRLQFFNFFFVVIVDRFGFKHCVYGTSNATWKDWDSLCDNRSGMLEDVVVSDAVRMCSCFDARDDCDHLRHCRSSYDTRALACKTLQGVG
jgi:hypothetical protein